MGSKWNHTPWPRVDSSLSGTAAQASGEKTSEVDGPGAPLRSGPF
jgi:hypothetical protein